ncbi:homeobox protein 2-like [Varroa jacobsoni]|uniref:homeobox protein 2-like n=1 Tax=Varroa jacobsoni TaxID=62625 RepID=UPI000BFA03E9|nr:homeobox protein 2-like [Varroa jacobsoni]XP_022691252.1 homeobox protein 2-like [Varroa jacobsoni]XP_022691253.1 homeobox protein 2-like [Varroa jacobsoni]XP_022691254.1 homeobox protein 2-like [Varroa jacobsoni]
MLRISSQPLVALTVLTIDVLHGLDTPPHLPATPERQKHNGLTNINKFRDSFVEQIRQVDPAIYKWYRDTYWGNCGLLESRPLSHPKRPPSKDDIRQGNYPVKSYGGPRVDQKIPSGGERQQTPNPHVPPTLFPPPNIFPPNIPAGSTLPPHNSEDTNYKPPVNNSSHGRQLNTQGLSIKFPSEDEEARNIARQDAINAQILRQRGYPYSGNGYFQTGAESFHNKLKQQQQQQQQSYQRFGSTYFRNGYSQNSYISNDNAAYGQGSGDYSNNRNVNSEDRYGNNNYNNGYNNGYANGSPSQSQLVIYRRQFINTPHVITLGNGDSLVLERQKRNRGYYAAEGSNVINNSGEINVGNGLSSNFAKSRSKREDFAPGVVGGNNAEKIYPWMVPIVAKGLEDGPYVIWCGASLVTERHLLTAAHCFDIRQDPTTFSALIRVHNLQQPETVVDIEKIIMHSDYQPGKFYNDVAIVTLVRSVPNAKPVCLPIEDPIGVDEPSAGVEVLGFGSLAFGEHASQTLQVASLEVFDNAACQANYSSKMDTALPQGIIKTHLCAGARDGSKDACQNDSGGPLVNDDQIGRKLLVGVVSFGYQCAREGYPGVYSNVKEFLPWIMPTIRKS